MQGFRSNIENDTLKNRNFRKVLYTSKSLQVVLMMLKPGEEFAEEAHSSFDQFFRFEAGTGKRFIDGYEYKVGNDDAIETPPGARHNVINAHPSKELMMYTIYSPLNHKDDVINSTKKDFELNDFQFDGKVTE